MDCSEMDGINKLLNKKIPSSSLIEVTTALIIISLVFTMAIVIYISLQRSGSFSSKLSYRVKMDELFISSSKAASFQPREVEYENFIVYQEEEPYGQVKDLLVVRLEARDKDGKLLAEQKHLVYAPVTEP